MRKCPKSKAQKIHRLGPLSVLPQSLADKKLIVSQLSFDSAVCVQMTALASGDQIQDVQEMQLLLHSFWAQATD